MEIFTFIANKLSQYNFLTNILPGTVLCILLKYVAGLDFILTADWYLAGIVFYFVGLVNNRFSSLIIEPLLRKCHFVKFISYHRYVAAEKIDSKVMTLSNENNVFRTYISTTILTLLGAAYKNCLENIAFFDDYGSMILMVLLSALFLFSYKKQTNYIVKRVERALKDKE